MLNMLLNGQTPKAVSEAVGVRLCMVRRWAERFHAEGLVGLYYSSRCDRMRQPTSQSTIDRIEALRRQRLTGNNNAPTTGSQTDQMIGVSAMNLTWSSRAASTTNYLYVPVGTNGASTRGSTTLAPICQFGGTPSTTDGRFTSISARCGAIGCRGDA